MHTPSWLTPDPPTVAIEIASRRVTVVEVSRHGGHATIVRQASEALPEGAVTPALSGVNVGAPDVVASAITRACQAAGLTAPGRAALVVPDSTARVSLLALDQMPARASDLDKLVRWQVRKSTPFPLEAAQLSYFPASSAPGATMMAVVVARQEVVREYEAVVERLGIHAGLVDLASLNIMNAVIGSGSAPDGDWLLVHVAAESTSVAILRGNSLLFYRHRTAVDEEPLGVLVHQTAMYHEDRLGGGAFVGAWISGAGQSTAEAQREVGGRLGLATHHVDVRPVASSGIAGSPSFDHLDALAAPVGVLLRGLAA